MTPEVKERIEQIRHGNVPEGYEKLPTGIFPRQWNSYRLDQLLEFKNGINADKEKFGHGTKLISVRDILSDRPIIYERILGTVDIDEQQRAEFAVEYGDVLFQRSSENYEDAGTSNVYLDQDNTAVFSGFVIRGKKKAEYNPVYINALLKCFYVRKQIMRQAAGAQHINIGQESLSKVCIALASSAEQNRIAEIITEQDKVIELKEKLLAEKQRQKKYLMQQLLTGKKRLPGFDGKWKSEKLSDFCDFVGGGTPDTKNPKYWNGAIPWISSSDLEMDNFRDIAITRYISEGAIRESSTKRCKAGTILLVSRVGVGKIAIAPVDLCTSQDFTNLVQQKHNATFLMYSLYLLMQAKSKQVQGSAIKGIPAKEIKEYSLSFPEMEEQNAIAARLTTADIEIDLLKQDIEQEKQKKKALMQLLLTGIVRVNV